MSDPNCIFCKIAKDEVPSQKAHHENGEIVSFANIKPQSPGHTLVIPRDHYRWFYDMPDELSNKLFNVAKKVAVELKEKYKTDFVRLSIVGEEMPHVHIHLIPQNLTDEILA